MKKLTIALLALTISTTPIQGMEKLKSWFGYAKKNTSQTQIEPDQTCPICYGTLLQNTPRSLTTLPCHSKHIFHSDCINLWEAHQLSMHGEATCPFCFKTYRKTLKADLMPSVYYTASMLFATLHYSLVRDWVLHPSEKEQTARGISGIIGLMNINGANLITTGLLERSHHNKQFPPWNPRNLTITTTLFLASAKYFEMFPIFNNKDATYTTQALTLCPLILSYFAASKLLKFESNQ